MSVMNTDANRRSRPLRALRALLEFQMSLWRSPRPVPVEAGRYDETLDSPMI